MDDRRREGARELDVGPRKEDGCVLALRVVLLPELPDLVHAVQLRQHVAYVGLLDPLWVMPPCAMVDTAVDLASAAVLSSWTDSQGSGVDSVPHTWKSWPYMVR